MKNKLALYGILGLFYLLVSCGDSENSVSEENESPVEVEKVEPPSGFEEYSNKFQKLVITDSGVFRGITFGMAVDEVKSLEDSATLIEKGDNFLNYSVEFTIKEQADVLYFFDKNQNINKIETDIYTESKQSQAKLFDEFALFFTKKYGEPVLVTENEKAWNASNNQFYIDMVKTGNEKVYDIKIVFTPGEKTATALNNL